MAGGAKNYFNKYKTQAQDTVRSLFNTYRNGGDVIGQMKNIGRTAAEVVGDSLINRGFDTVRDFASNRLSTIAPSFVKPFESGAESLKNQLQSGYHKLINGGRTESLRSMGAGQGQNFSAFDSLTK